MPRVLFVEDNEYLRKIVPYTLKQDGIDTHAVATASEALACLREEHFDMVVTDINMPGMNGLELISKLKALPAYQATPVLCLTTEIAPETLAEAKQRGAIDIVLKPYSPQQLLNAIQQHL